MPLKGLPLLIVAVTSAATLLPDPAAAAPRRKRPAPAFVAEAAASAAPATDPRGEHRRDPAVDADLAALTAPELDVRRAAATRLAKPREPAPVMVARMSELRSAGEARHIAALVRAAEQGARTAGDSFDVLEALLSAPPLGEPGTPARYGPTKAEVVKIDPAKEEPSRRAALAEVCFLRALAAVGTTPALRALVGADTDALQAFRPEIARIVKPLGDRVVPALALARGSPSAMTRTFAQTLLESLGRRTTADMVQLADRNLVLEVVQAFGTTKDLDGLPVLLSMVSVEQEDVQTKAREAVLAYGPAAIFKLREAYGNTTGQPADDTWTAVELAHRLFEAADELRLREAYKLLDEGLALEEKGDVGAAVARFDRLLAEHPEMPRRKLMASAFLKQGLKLEETDPAAAMAYYQKALYLAPDGTAAAQAQAGLAYLEGKTLAERGVDDPEPLQRALELAPDHAGAKTLLAQLEDRGTSRDARRKHLGGGLVIAGAAALLAGLGLAYTRLQRRRATSA